VTTPDSPNDQISRDVRGLRNWNPWKRRAAARALQAVNWEAVSGQETLSLIALLLEASDHWRIRPIVLPTLTRLLNGLDVRENQGIDTAARQRLYRLIEHTTPKHGADFLLAAIRFVDRHRDLEAEKAISVALANSTLPQPRRGEEYVSRGRSRSGEPPHYGSYARYDEPFRRKMRRVHTAARGCLYRLEQAALQASLQGGLLRPAEPIGGHDLLRPARDASAEDGDTLLRPPST
jgi:hypothetical protein